MDRLLEELHLSGDEEEELAAGDEVNVQTGDLNLTVVGRILTVQTLNFNIVKSRMTSIWNPRQGVQFRDIGEGRFLIQFSHKLDFKRFVDELPQEVPLNKIPFWVQIYDLPVGYFTEGIVCLLGNFIGHFMEYDATNIGAVIVELNVDNPLKKIKLSDGLSRIATFRYERLNTFCFICGRLRHTESYCEVLFNAEGEDIPRSWGPNLNTLEHRVSAAMGGR
ncbi:hypothetical protein ACS0TY_016501 [Phlomoides rotata]